MNFRWTAGSRSAARVAAGRLRPFVAAAALLAATSPHAAPPYPWFAALPAWLDARIAAAFGFAARASGDPESASRWWEACAEFAARSGALRQRLDCLGVASAASLQAGELERAAALQQRRFDLAVDRSSVVAVDAQLKLGALARRSGRLAEAESAFRLALRAARAIDDRASEAQAHSGLAMLAKNRGDYHDALEAETAALTIRQELGARGNLQVSYTSLSALYEQMEDLPKARDFQARALAAAMASPDPLAAPTAQVSMAGLLNDSGPEYAPTALALARAADATHTRLGNRPGMLDARFHIGRALLLLGRLEEAQAALDPLPAEATALGQRASRAHVLLRLAELAQARGRRDRAIALASESLALYVALDNPHRQVKAHALLGTLYAAAGDAASASRHEIARLNLRERLLGAAPMRRVGVLLDQYRAQRDADRIRLLEQTNQIADARRERDAYLRGVYALVGLSLALALLLLALRYRASVRENRRLSEREQRAESERKRLALANVQLYTSATTDPLTGLANRSLGVERLRQRLAGASADSVIAIGLVDVDHFKQINDTHGHLIGDAVLRETALALRGQLADAVVVARFGGEEFLVVLDGAIAEDAVRRFVAAGRAVALTRVPVLPSVTVSIGWCMQRGGGGDIDVLVAAADAALYRAKALGRNRVEGSAEPVAL